MSNFSMDIGDVSRASGFPVSTLRYYEKAGLIRSIGREGLRRQFNKNVIERLALISLGKRAGFSLEEIGKIFTPKGVKINRSMLKQRADELGREIEKLQLVQQGLLRAANCKATNHMECSGFKALLDAETPAGRASEKP